MPIFAAVIGGGLGLLGSSMQAGAITDAAGTSADAQLAAARLAAEEARFRPVGITTRFGGSTFGFDENGRLTSAGYVRSPMLEDYQRRLEALTGQRLSEAEAASQYYEPLRMAGRSIMDLGESYLRESPKEVAEKYMASQMDLLAPTRERQLAGVRTNLFNTGRTGLSIGATGERPGGGAGLAAANPEMEAYYNALAQQDAALSAEAQKRGQEQYAFGTSLFNTGAGLLGQYESGVTGALSPFMTTVGGISSLEDLALRPLDIGAQLGGRSATAGGNVGQFLYGGGMGAARTMEQANMLNPTASFLQGLGSNDRLMSGLGNLFSSYNLRPQDRYNLGQWSASQAGYLDPNYMGP
jgi:hypothetical protein